MRESSNLLEPQIKRLLRVWCLPSDKCTLHSHTPFSHILHRGRKAIKRHGKPAVQHLLDDLNALVALIARLCTLFMPSVEGGNECHVGHARDDTASKASG